MSISSKEVLKRFNDLPLSAEWSFSQFCRVDTMKLSHSYHRYPAKFIPQLVDELIRQYTKEGDLICDPFGGCGTTLVESKAEGRRSIGFDINPVAKLITDTKTRAIKPEKLQNARSLFLRELGINGTKKVSHTHNARIEYWFDAPIIEKLDIIYAAILQIRDKEVKRFYLCAFSHVLKNCSRWLMKSIKPTIDKSKIFPDPQTIYLRHLDSMIKKNKQLFDTLKESGRLNVPAEMTLWNSTKRLPLKESSVDLIITSPPYVTSYEYADLHQLSLLWFGDDKKHFSDWGKFVDEFMDFRAEFIGSSFKPALNQDFRSAIADDIVFRLSLQDHSLSKNVANYFTDMRASFEEMYRVLKKGRKACVIIGNTELRGVPILNAEVAVEQMVNIGFQGFSKSEIIKREVSNKMITPWRDIKTGKFTSKSNSSKKRAYECEYVLLMEK